MVTDKPRTLEPASFLSLSLRDVGFPPCHPRSSEHLREPLLGGWMSKGQGVPSVPAGLPTQLLPHPESWFFPGRWHFHLDLGFKALSLGRGCCAGSSCLCGLFSSYTEQGPPSSCAVGFSLWLLLLWSTGLRVHQLQ